MSLSVVILLLVASAIGESTFISKTSSTLTELEDNFPSLSRSLAKLKTDMGLPIDLSVNDTQETALRLSEAINIVADILSKDSIDRSVVTTCGTLPEELNGNGKEYIYHVNFFDCFLQQQWGLPDQDSVTAQTAIDMKEGILIFSQCSGTTPALDRIDVWDGSVCKFVQCPEEVFDTDCGKVKFYEMA